jgi:hypothetical protein
MYTFFTTSPFIYKTICYDFSVVSDYKNPQLICNLFSLSNKSYVPVKDETIVLFVHSDSIKIKKFLPFDSIRSLIDKTNILISDSTISIKLDELIIGNDYKAFIYSNSSIDKSCIIVNSNISGYKLLPKSEKKNLTFLLYVFSAILLFFIPIKLLFFKIIKTKKLAKESSFEGENPKLPANYSRFIKVSKNMNKVKNFKDYF